MKRNSELNKDRINEIISVALGAMSVIAIVGILVKKDFETNEVFGSIINFTQVGIPLLVLIITARMHRRSNNFLSEGKKALERLRKKHPDILAGPQYNQEDYDPEEKSKVQRHQYLYFGSRKNLMPSNQNKRVAFVPVDPLEQGILDIRITKSTIAFFKNLNNAEQGDEEKDVNDIKEKIRKAIEAELPDPEKTSIKPKSRKYENLYEYKKNYTHSALRIDFEQDRLKLNDFNAIIYKCCEKAIKVLKENT